MVDMDEKSKLKSQQIDEKTNDEGDK